MTEIIVDLTTVRFVTSDTHFGHTHDTDQGRAELAVKYAAWLPFGLAHP